MAWPKKRMPIVEVEWLDSASCHGWLPVRDAATAVGRKPLSCKSAGYLWKRNKHRLVLLQSQSASRQVDACFGIPAKAVVRVTVLAPASNAAGRVG